MSRPGRGFPLVPRLGGGLFTAAAYALVCAAGSYAAAGTAASLEYNAEVQAAAGSYTASGTAASLEYNAEVQAASGSYAVAGTAASLEYNAEVQAASGSYAVTGTAASLEYNAEVQAASGSYAVTGTAASLEYNAEVQAASGSVAVAGTAASLTFGYRVVCASGSYAVAGTATSLEYNAEVQAASGAYAVAGTAANLAFGFRLVCDSGSHAVAGTAASLEYNAEVQAASGSVAVAGTAASLEYNAEVQAASGSVAVVGTAASLELGSALVCASGSYAVAGTAASLEYNAEVQAASSSYAVAGAAANLLLGARLSAGSGAIVVSGTAATLTGTSTALVASAGSVAVAGSSATLSTDHVTIIVVPVVESPPAFNPIMRASVVAIGSAVTELGGRVFDGTRYLGGDAVRNYLGMENSLPTISGAFVTRVSRKEYPYTQLNTMGTEHWEVTILMGFVNEEQSKMESVLGTTRRALRDKYQIGTLYDINVDDTTEINVVKEEGLLLEKAVLGYSGTGTYLMVDPGMYFDKRFISDYKGTQTERPGKYDTGIEDDIASIIKHVSPHCQVIIGNRLMRTPREIQDSISSTDTTGELPRIHSWQIKKGADQEEKGLGSRTETTTTWHLDGVMSWSDEDGTYERLNTEVDTLASSFRYLQHVGARDNQTQIISGPLQLDEFESIAGLGGLIHLAKCSVEVKEVVHSGC